MLESGDALLEDFDILLGPPRVVVVLEELLGGLVVLLHTIRRSVCVE
jgi:hypothetical protein